VADITMSNLVATPGDNQVLLSFAYSDPNVSPDQTALQIAAVEVYWSKTNDRDQALFWGEAGYPFTSFLHAKPPGEGDHYYWVRSRDNSGTYGPWHPSGATDGVRSRAIEVQKEVSALRIPEIDSLSVVSGGPTANHATWTFDDPNIELVGGLLLEAVELWAAPDNDRSGATLVAEGKTNAVHAGLLGESTPYYWARPRDKDGNYGDWYPSSSSAGVRYSRYRCESSTSQTIASSGSKVITVPAGLAYLENSSLNNNCRVRLTSRGTANTWMEGRVTAYSGTSLTFTAEASLGSGTHTDWTVDLPGEIDDYGWHAWEDGSGGSPGVSALSGTITTPGSVLVHYKIDENICHIAVYATITTNGTGADEVVIELPIGVPFPGEQLEWVLSGWGSNSGGEFSIHAEVGTLSLRVRKYDGSYPGGDNSIIALSGSYRIR
jgi:hypothetical protein